MTGVQTCALPIFLPDGSGIQMTPKPWAYNFYFAQTLNQAVDLTEIMGLYVDISCSGANSFGLQLQVFDSDGVQHDITDSEGHDSIHYTTTGSYKGLIKIPKDYGTDVRIGFKLTAIYMGDDSTVTFKNPQYVGAVGSFDITNTSKIWQVMGAPGNGSQIENPGSIANGSWLFDENGLTLTPVTTGDGVFYLIAQTVRTDIDMSKVYGVMIDIDDNGGPNYYQIKFDYFFDNADAHQYTFDPASGTQELLLTFPSEMDDPTRQLSVGFQLVSLNDGGTNAINFKSITFVGNQIPVVPATPTIAETSDSEDSDESDINMPSSSDNVETGDPGVLYFAILGLISLGLLMVFKKSYKEVNIK